MRALRLPTVAPPDTEATPWVPRVRHVSAAAAGVIDLTSGAMLLALASGLGVVAPALIGGFGTALVVGLAGALALGTARGLRAPSAMRDGVVVLSRLSAVVAQLLVLASATGVVVVMVSAALSLVLSVVLLVAVLVPWVIARRSRG